MPNEKSALIQVRLTGAEKRRVQNAAARDGVTVSEWLRTLMQRAADEASHTGHADSKLQRR